MAKYGFPDAAWEAAKNEAKSVLTARAPTRNLISYSDLCRRITAINLDAHSPVIAHFLDEISREENAAGRGLMSVLVVHKHGDQMPGPGFFHLARSVGRDTTDRELFWISELEYVASSHAGRVGREHE